MPGAPEPSAAGRRTPSDLAARNVGVGCVTAIAGLFSGGMIGVLISKIVASITHAPKCADLPTCDWYKYAAVGMLVGVITLPLLTLMRLRRSDAETTNSERG
jgi:hypothetical protein